MFVINISIDKIDTLHQIAAIRINPKHTPKPGEICTYQWGTLDSKDHFNKLGQFDKVYKTNDALDFSFILLNLYKGKQ